MKLSTKLLFHFLLISVTFVIRITGLPVDDGERDTGNEASDTGSDTLDTPFENKYTLTPDIIDDISETDTINNKSNTDSTKDDISEDIDSDTNKSRKKIEETDKYEKDSKTRYDGKLDTEDKITKRSAEVLDAVVCRCYKESNPDQVLSTHFTSNVIPSNGGSTNYDIQCSGRQSGGGTLSNSGSIASETINGESSGVKSGLQLSYSSGDLANGAFNQRISGDSSFIDNGGNLAPSSLPNNYVESQQSGGIANVDGSFSSDTKSNLNNFGNGQVTGIEHNPLGVVEVSGDMSALAGDTSALTSVSGDKSEIIGGTSSLTGDTLGLSGEMPLLTGDVSIESNGLSTSDITGSNIEAVVSDGNIGALPTPEIQTLTGAEGGSFSLEGTIGDSSHLTGEVNNPDLSVIVSGDSQFIDNGGNLASSSLPNNYVESQLGGGIVNVDGSFSSDTKSNLNNFGNEQATGIEHNPLGGVEASGDMSALTGDASALTGVSGDTSEMIGGMSSLTGDTHGLSGEMPLLTGDISIENNGQSTSDITGSNLEAVVSDGNIGALPNSEIQPQSGAEEGNSFSLEGTIDQSSQLTDEVNTPNIDVIDLSSGDAQTGDEQSLDF